MDTAMRILAFIAALLLALPAHAQTQDLPQRVGPFGEAATYELTNIISLQSTFGTSVSRDIETTTNSGSIGLDGGYIEVKTGTTTGSDARLRTAARGQYQPGKGAEAGTAVTVITAPTGDGVAEWGLGDTDNGAFWRLKGDGSRCVVYERSDTEQEFCDDNLNGQNSDTWQPTSLAHVYVIRFNWYGVGGAQYIAYVPDERYNGTLRPIVVHTFVPANGQAMEDPNQPIFAFVDNGTTTTDVEVEVGGRRYDVQGSFDPPVKRTHARRTGVSVGTSYTPIICARAEEPFPEAGRQNSVHFYVDRVQVGTQTEGVQTVYATVDATDITNASFVDPPDYTDSETALEVDLSGTAISNFTILNAGTFFEAGATPNQVRLTEAREGRIELIGDDPTCLLAKTDANTATVEATLVVAEELN